MVTIIVQPFTFRCFDGGCVGTKRPDSNFFDAVLATLPDGRKKIFASVLAVEQWIKEHGVSAKVET